MSMDRTRSSLFRLMGGRYRQETSVARSRATQQRWFDLINLDLKFRHAAGLGAETVRRNQELFARGSAAGNSTKRCPTANRRLARLNAAAVLAQRVSDKHVARLSPDTLLTLAEPIQPYVKAVGGAAVVDELRRNGAPSSFASRGLRRIFGQARGHGRGTGTWPGSQRAGAGNSRRCDQQSRDPPAAKCANRSHQRHAAGAPRACRANRERRVAVSPRRQICRRGAATPSGGSRAGV